MKSLLLITDATHANKNSHFAGSSSQRATNVSIMHELQLIVPNRDIRK